MEDLRHRGKRAHGHRRAAARRNPRWARIPAHLQPAARIRPASHDPTHRVTTDRARQPPPSRASQPPPTRVGQPPTVCAPASASPAGRAHGDDHRAAPAAPRQPPTHKPLYYSSASGPWVTSRWNCAASMMRSPSSSAFASFEPAPGPAATKSVFFDTDDAALPPA